jgi:hypothetical protein
LRPSARRSLFVTTLNLVALAVQPPSAVGQEVSFQPRGSGLPLADEVLTGVLARHNYQVFVRDTVLRPSDVVEGDLIVIRASLRVEGRIRGDLIGVQSDIFARPGAQIEGTVAVLGGGFYGSSLARLGAPPVNAAAYAYEVQEREGGDYLVSAPGAEAKLRLPGLYGLLAPQYDRVNALSLEVGLEFERGASRSLPNASARARYRSVRSDVDGDLQLSWPFGRHRISLRGGLTVRSNDRWINSDLENSIYAFVAGLDTRNYYEAAFAEAEFNLEYGSRFRWWLDLLAGWERARSLPNRDPFSLFSARGGFQDNLLVTEADAASVTLAGGFKSWIGGSIPLELELSVEHADKDVTGDLSFTVFGGAMSMEIPTMAGQQLVLEGRGQVPRHAGTPPQRWRALGGWGSLPTLRPVEQVGDVMWWGAASYRVSVRRNASLLTRVVLWLQYAAGHAWVDGSARPPTVHNLALGATFGPLAAAVYSDPSADFKTVLALGIDTRR